MVKSSTNGSPIHQRSVKSFPKRPPYIRHSAQPNALTGKQIGAHPPQPFALPVQSKRQIQQKLQFIIGKRHQQQNGVFIRIVKHEFQHQSFRTKPRQKQKRKKSVPFQTSHTIFAVFSYRSTKHCQRKSVKKPISGGQKNSLIRQKKRLCKSTLQAKGVRSAECADQITTCRQNVKLPFGQPFGNTRPSAPSPPQGRVKTKWWDKSNRRGIHADRKRLFLLSRHAPPSLPQQTQNK